MLHVKVPWSRGVKPGENRRGICLCPHPAWPVGPKLWPGAQPPPQPPHIPGSCWEPRRPPTSQMCPLLALWFFSPTSHCYLPFQSHPPCCCHPSTPEPLVPSPEDFCTFTSSVIYFPALPSPFVTIKVHIVDPHESPAPLSLTCMLPVSSISTILQPPSPIAHVGLGPCHPTELPHRL